MTASGEATPERGGADWAGPLHRRLNLLVPLPSLPTFLLVLGFPIAFVLDVSLHDRPISPAISSTFPGLGNHVALLSSPRFWGPLWITFYFTALALGWEPTR